MISDDELSLGGYRYEDLLELRIVSNRTDLARKQTDLGFPFPVKTGASQATFLKFEVHAWLRMRAALRDIERASATLPERSPRGSRPPSAVKPGQATSRAKVLTDAT